MAEQLGVNLCDPRQSEGHRDHADKDFVHFRSAEAQKSIFSNSINIQNSMLPNGKQLEILQSEELRLGS